MDDINVPRNSDITAFDTLLLTTASISCTAIDTDFQIMRTFEASIRMDYSYLP